MKILSLFDGISIAQQALKESGIPVETYYASEIDKYAISIARKNFPNTIQLGSVTGVGKYISIPTIGAIYVIELPQIDLLIGGSPCQDLSIAKKDRKGLCGNRSGLFWEYVRILKEVKPKYFVLENVNLMPKEAKQIISETLGVEPIMINASLVSAQIRKRLFWVGKLVGDNYVKVDICLPGDREIYLKDIILDGHTDDLKSLCTTASYYKKNYQNFIKKRDGQMIVREATKKGYAVANDGDSIDLSFPNSKTRRGRVGNKVKNLMTSQNIAVYTKDELRKLHPIECERLQSLPDNYTEGISNSQRYKALGNGFNCEVIKHILKNLK